VPVGEGVTGVEGVVKMEIGDRPVGPNESPYFVAEAGVNHNGEVEMAMDLVDAAAEAGADAVKFQTFDADRLVTDRATTADYQAEATGEDSQRDLLSGYELDRSAHERIAEGCRSRGIDFLSTPFDSASAEMLVELGVPAIKLGSGELDNHPLLEHVASLGRPMLISTGMATMSEVHAARAAVRGVAPDRSVVWLHCTSAYPCEVDDVHLRAMERMDDALPEPVGYSDHTRRPETPGLAVAAGACVVEKHFTLDTSLPGPDHEASLEPDELARAVELVEVAGRARGTPSKEPTPAEQETREVARKSIHAARDITAGSTIERSDLRIARPADGISPRHLDRVLGTTVRSDLTADEPLTPADVSGEFD
jgi:N,N'-diacetyllegionaminate synthase